MIDELASIQLNSVHMERNSHVIIEVLSQHFFGEGLRKTSITSISIASILQKIQTEHLINTSLE
jgi:hypothetical protein